MELKVLQNWTQSFLEICFFPSGDNQYTTVSKEESDQEENNEKEDKAEDDKEKDEDDKKESAASAHTMKVSPGNFSDLEELLFCRSANQIKVEMIHKKTFQFFNFPILGDTERVCRPR